VLRKINPIKKSYKERKEKGKKSWKKDSLE
jgi:hypothetical protein